MGAAKLTGGLCGARAPGPRPRSLCHKDPTPRTLAWHTAALCIPIQTQTHRHRAFGCSCSAAPMGLCLSVALWKDKAYARRRAVRRGQQEAVDVDVMVRGGGGSSSVYGLLAGGVPEAEEPVAVAAPRASGALGTPGRPIWQRRVLMGVKCRLPKFSGMILYDERGRPVGGGVRDRARDQEKHAAAIDNILRDLHWSSRSPAGSLIPASARSS
ncbi:hypothetical protein CFC21_110968 [Triticum aestivum]|uniref:Uncharacterized protein n=2 Tax=Triticum aestivum TaxID=4565 RepID=A0A3B6TQ19_WHEAT|nr:uncharacterized protein LOC123164620 [Triticum aestivum]KAF7110902.1 hypothetical protein CFC21_110968 [Triticum aestivum]